MIAGVRADQLDLPTPCVEFTVKEILDHLVFVLHRVAKLCRGEEAFAPVTMADDVVEHIDWAADWRIAESDVNAAAAGDGVLDRMVVLPWASMTGVPRCWRPTSPRSPHIRGISPRPPASTRHGTTPCCRLSFGDHAA